MLLHVALGAPAIVTEPSLQLGAWMQLFKPAPSLLGMGGGWTVEWGTEFR